MMLTSQAHGGRWPPGAIEDLNASQLGLATGRHQRPLEHGGGQAATAR